MRILSQIMVASFAFAASALAQSQTPYSGFHAEYEKKPNREAVERYYPKRALDRSVTGGAVLCCVPGNDRRLQCKIGYESIEGWQFGSASLGMAKLLRLTPESYNSFVADKTNWLAVYFTFTGFLDRAAAAKIQDEIGMKRSVCRPDSALNS